MQIDNDQTILLFDGVCYLCDGAVRFILKRENSKELKFTPLQSEAGSKLLKIYGYPEDYLGGLVLIENKKAYDRSCACLRVAGKLRFPWKHFFLFLIIPKPIRDLVYKIIAIQRYRFFGKKDTCALPWGEDTARFI